MKKKKLSNLHVKLSSCGVLPTLHNFILKYEIKQELSPFKPSHCYTGDLWKPSKLQNTNSAAIKPLLKKVHCNYTALNTGSREGIPKQNPFTASLYRAHRARAASDSTSAQGVQNGVKQKNLLQHNINTSVAETERKTSESVPQKSKQTGGGNNTRETNTAPPTAKKP